MASGGSSSYHILPRLLGGLIVLALLICGGMMMWFNHEPVVKDPLAQRHDRGARGDAEVPAGYDTTAELIESLSTMLNKRGGYISDARYPPRIFLDNIPSWEFGVLTSARELTQALMNQFSRSSESEPPDPDLEEADKLLAYDHTRSQPPNAESQYRKAVASLEAYQQRLLPGAQHPAHFFATAENLDAWLAVLEKNLKTQSQQLAVSGGQLRVNAELAEAPGESHPHHSITFAESSWGHFDNAFYVSRGMAWSSVLYLRVMERDFAQVLQQHHAMEAYRLAIRQLEYALAPLEAPMLRNGPPFGLLANQPIMLANYLSLARYAVKDLRAQLQSQYQDGQ